ncbi:MAG: ATP-grasp domain-containing protein [Clostridia bacterium]|nr:ATP-grasp domain-containing protein [Clostridia bacterium]
MNILFTCVGRRIELIQAFKTAAENLKTNLVIHGTDTTNTAPALFFCDIPHIVPKIKNPAYIPKLLEICREGKVDALIPTIDTDLLILSENKESFEKVGTKVLISNPEAIRICRDKRITGNFFGNCGLSYPRTFDNAADYSMNYPCFIKPKDGSSSIFAYKVNNERELMTYAVQVPDYIIQPYIEGTEYTVDIFCDFEGNPIYITPRVRLAVRAGEVLKTQILHDTRIIEEALSITEKFKPCCAITVQLIKESVTGENYYIEINPRFGGGAPLSMKAGANSAEALIRLLKKEKLSYQSNAAENNAVYCRFDQSIKVN